MKVSDVTIKGDQLSSSIDLELDALPVKVREQVKQDVGDFLKEKILEKVSSGKSPVAGERFSPLDPAYAKKAHGGNRTPRLEDTGDMLDSLDYKITTKGIDLGIFGSGEGDKADGHNNFSGKSQIPQRRFLPDEGQDFQSDIQKGIEQIVADALADSVPVSKDELEGISSKAELYDRLSEVFQGMTRAEIRSAVLRSPDFSGLLDDLDLLDLL